MVCRIVKELPTQEIEYLKESASELSGVAVIDWPPITKDSLFQETNLTVLVAPDPETLKKVTTRAEAKKKQVFTI